MEDEQEEMMKGNECSKKMEDRQGELKNNSGNENENDFNVTCWWS